MAGLLDNFTQDDILSGLLSAGAASGAKGNYLARVAAGLAQGERFKQGRQEQARQRSQDEMQAEYKQLLMAKAKMEMAQTERAGLAETKKASELERIDGLIRNAGQVRGGMGAGLPAGALPDDLSMPSQPALQLPGIDYRALLQQGVPLDRLKALADSANLGRPEVARTVKGLVNGREVEQGQDKFGNLVGNPMEQYKAPIEMATGDRKSMLDAYSLKPLASFNMGQSPDSVASNATAQRGQNLTNARAVERFAFDQAGGADAGKPQLVDGKWIYKPNAQFPQGRTIPVDGFSKSPDAAQTKQLAGVESLNSAIGEYVTQLDKWGKFSVLSPTARAEMGTKYNHMMLQAKEAYNLGVLNGPDLDILTSVVTDPRSYTGVLTGNDAMKNQALELSRMMSKGVAPAVRDAGANAERGQPAAADLTYKDPSKENAYQQWVRRNKG